MFSKSKTKRFIEPTLDGPAVGQYDVKDINAKSKAVSFIKDKRWKKGEENGSSSLENLNNSGGLSFGFGHNRPLVPIAQSTCTGMSKKSRRNSCFPVSNSATDLRSCRRLNLSRSLEDDIGYQTDKVTSLKQKIIKLQSEIDAMKSSSEKTKINNEELKASLDEILNEKLATELENQRLTRNMISINEEESKKTGKMVKCLNQIELSLPSIINETIKSFNELEKSFEEKQDGYLRRLDGANSLLGNIQMASDKVEDLEKRCTSLQCDYDMLIAERSIKENLIEEQKKKMMEFANSVGSLMDQLKLKGDVCDSLNTQLDYTVKEKVQTETLFSEEKENILKQIAVLELIHEKDLKELNDKLLSTQSLNAEYRKQIENVELSMTENIREISRKYECLEETFDKTQKEYQRSLERSNSLVQKVTLANKVNIEEFENLRNMYTELLHDYEKLCVDCETKDNMMLEKDQKLDGYKDSIVLLEDQLNSIERAKEDACSILNKRVDHLNEEVMDKDQKICHHENSINLLEGKLSSIERAHEEACDIQNKQIGDLIEELKDKQIAYEEEKECLSRELSDIKLSMQACSSISQEDVDQLQMKLSEAENCGETWKLKFEELQRKVGPFMDQLEQYEFEKQSLLNQNLLSQQEMKKLSEKYGNILGHQNNKQKIRHISKLKEENLQLKADLVKLRASADKDRMKMSQLESKAHGKRFDPSKSFSHGKENRDALKTVNS